MKNIELTRGKCVLVDDDDFRWLSQLKWYAANQGTHKKAQWYAVTTDKAHHRMHRLILKAPANLLVDHIDGNGLNNQKINLRLVTYAQNAKNRARTLTPGTSPYKGVNWYPLLKQWIARVQVDRKSIHIGYFDSEIEAAVAYDIAASKVHGEYARLNFP